MSHYSRLSKIVIDVPGESHAAELAFWQAAIGQPLTQSERNPEYHGAMLPGEQFEVLVQRLDEGSARVHLDVHTDDVPAEVARLQALGAQRVQQVKSWWVLRDPAGLPFCVIPASADELTEGKAQRWD